MRPLKPVRLGWFIHRFCVTGLNLERFINLLSKNSIPLVSIRRADSRTLVCECFSCDLPSICTLAQEKGWRIHQSVPLRWSARLKWLRQRPGIPAGVVLTLVAVMILSGFVWRVEIHGAGSYQADISAFLEESGYSAGRARNSIDAEALEQLLTHRYPKIAWFHAYVSGVTLMVDVTPGVSMPVLPSDIPCDIVAARGGIVESIQVYAGTAAVKPGDVVRKGQTLIRGIERSFDGATVDVAAEGVVNARCWQSCTVQMPLYEIESKETGRQTVFTRLSTPMWQQPVQNADYLAYNTYMEEMPVVGSFFPVILQRITQREVSMQYTSREMETVRQEAGEAALKRLKLRLFGYEIIDKWVDYCMIEGDTLAVTATAEWLMDIGSDSLP